MKPSSSKLALAALLTGLALPVAAQTESKAPPAASTGSGVETGKLAWYGKKFAGRKTASGERYNPNALTTAHNTLPFGTKVKVTNLANNKSVVVRVNDRGPHDGSRLGDVSAAAAKRLGMTKAGVIDARLEVVGKKA
jgi:rare lipoprotein A